MPVGKDHAWVVRDAGGQGWAVVTGPGGRDVIVDGVPTRAAAREAARLLNGRRLHVTRAWKTAGRQWLLTTEDGRLVGTYETRKAARDARALLC